VNRPTQVCSNWFRLKLREILTFACMTKLRPSKPTQKLTEYGDCLFTLQTDEPCGDEGTFANLCTRVHFNRAMSLYQSYLSSFSSNIVMIFLCSLSRNDNHCRDC